MSVTEGSGVYAVIAPNMGKQIVALQVCNHETVCCPYVAGRQESYLVQFVCPRWLHLSRCTSMSCVECNLSRYTVSRISQEEILVAFFHNNLEVISL